MGKVTEEQILEWCMKYAPPNAKVKKHEKDGVTFFTIGELNIDMAARLLLPYINFYPHKDEFDKLDKDNKG